ncbi:hypothetical protein X975_02863, partial [Stegodyphus mimosarum]
MNLLLILFLAAVMLFVLGESYPKEVLSSFESSSKIADVASILTEAEPRQMGLLGFTALGALMFPILVSLGMASFVSHLPTVFKELASEFGIPATPPRTFLLFRGKRNVAHGMLDYRWENILNNFERNVLKNSDKGESFYKILHKRK